MLKYRTGILLRSLIESVEVDRETVHSVWVDGSRLLKRSEFDQFHDTWEEAQAFLLRGAEESIRGLKLQLNKARGLHGNIKGLKNQ